MFKYVVSWIVSLLFLVSFGFAGKIRLEPSSGEFVARCPFSVKVMVDTEWVESNTLWFTLFVDDSLYTINGVNTDGAIYPAYTNFVKGKAWHGDKKWMSVVSMMGTTAGKNWFSGKWAFATLSISSLIWVKDLNIDIYAIPWYLGDDSNINYSSWDQIYDALTEALGAHYTFVEWVCPNPEEPLTIWENDPVLLQQNDNSLTNLEKGWEDLFARQWFSFKAFLDGVFNNIDYIIIVVLALLILFILLSLKNKKNK